MRALLHLLETITIRIRSHAENDPSPKETQTETMVGPSQAFALLLRVLFAWHAGAGCASVSQRIADCTATLGDESVLAAKRPASTNSKC